MSDNNNNAKTMYEAVPAAAELNKVPGFDPLKFLRRAGDSMKLDLPYQKLWFRMAHPNGRMRLTAMRITEQMAIFEAKVFLDRSDAEPFSVSVAQQTMQDSRDFVKAAQNEALSQALSDAGFGIQLVSADTHAASVQKAAPVSKTQPSAITPPVSTVLPQEPSSASQKAAVLSEGIKEGRMLHHCVGNDGAGERYYDRIERRESFIMFLRRAEEPEDPYYTLEIEPDGTVRQKRTLFDRQHEDIEQATEFLQKWQKVIAARLTGQDLKLAAQSRVLRNEEFIQMKKDRVVIHTGHLAGHLLADVLLADLMENKEIVQQQELPAAA